MKECGVPGDTIIGRVCRQISGIGEGSCYLSAEAECESAKTAECLEGLVTCSVGCPFRQKVLERIGEKKNSGSSKCGLQ